VDTKKKELVGQFANGGREWQPSGEPERVNVHDFPDPKLGKAIPYGVYDIGANSGWVSVGCDHDTAAFAVQTLRRWWQQVGSHAYPQADRLLVCADAGGSNGYRVRAWKTELARLAAETGLQITVCHLPPGTSKWNRIEHRLFSHISMNWRGRPLTSHEAIVELIGATTTHTGLRVRAELDRGRYPLGVKVGDQELAGGGAACAPRVPRRVELHSARGGIASTTGGKVAIGRSNDEIAKELVLSPATVRIHVSCAMVQPGACDRASSMVSAVRAALTSPDRCAVSLPSLSLRPVVGPRGDHPRDQGGEHTGQLDPVADGHTGSLPANQVGQAAADQEPDGDEQPQERSHGRCPRPGGQAHEDRAGEQDDDRRRWVDRELDSRRPQDRDPQGTDHQAHNRRRPWPGQPALRMHRCSLSAWE
jgi:DDE family transposase